MKPATGQILLLAALAGLVSASCARARFTEFRGENLGASRSALSHGAQLAERHCSTCHLKPLPESMSQPTANYMLAYMGLFLGIDASRKLDDAERAQFKVRYELLKRSGSIPSQLSLTADEWKDLRAYYLGLARYPFVSGEKTHTPATTAVTYSDQAVTMLKPLADGRYVVGGGLTNRLFFYSAALAEEFSVLLDSPPVHLVERDGGYYVLTIGSILGAVGDENRSALYFIARGSRKAQPIAQNLMRSAHFLCVDANRDGRTDFLLAGFGNITGGGLLLIESNGATYKQKILSKQSSIVRLALEQETAGKIRFFALAGGAQEGLFHFELENGVVRERELTKYPPHLGSVWLEYSDIDGDGQKEILVLSGDNADAGPYNEVKPDQGLRIYSFDGNKITQKYFASLPGALTLSLIPQQRGADIAIARFYASPVEKQDITLLAHSGNGHFTSRHLSLNSRAAMVIPRNGSITELLIGSANAPLSYLDEDQIKVRHFSGAPLVTAKLATR